MKQGWIKGLNKEDAERMEQDFNSSVALRSQAIKILQDKMDTAISEMLDKKSFDTASWTAKQAERIGYIRSLKEIIEIFK